MTTAIHRRTRTVRQRQRPHSHPARLQLHLALRLLRQGYLHVYMPQAAAGTEQWRTYHVDDEANMRLIGPGFVAPAAGTKIPPCQTPGHDAYGQKLITIPNASRMSEVWLAFSANLWSDKLKDQNKANPKAMVKFNPKSGGANTFKPTKEELSKRVLECAMDALRIDGMGDNNALPQAVQPSFPFAPLMGSGRGKDYKPSDDSRVQRLADALAKAAASSPATKGKELAVVVPDPVGVAAELNGLRLLRFELAKQEMAKPENAHPLVSLQMLDGLRQSVVDTQEARSFEVMNPVMNRGAFETIMHVRPNPRGWPEGTRWEPMTDKQDLVRHGQGMGRVVFPDQEVRRRAWAAKATERNWQRYRQYVDEGKLKDWKDAFDKKMLAAHGEPLKLLEAEWWTACQSAGMANCFAQHFDDKAPNPPGTGQGHCSGTAYATEVRLAMTPQPLQRGDTFERYLAELQKVCSDKTAYLQRALAGNQSEVLDAWASYAQDSRPDKLHDFAAGLLKGADTKAVLGRHHIKFSWLLHAAYGVNTLAIAQSLTAGGAAALAVLGGKGPAGEALVRRLERLLMGTQAMLLARESAIRQTRLEVPVQVQVRLPGAEARRHLAARQASGGDVPTVREANRMASRNAGALLVTLTTTNLELQRVGFDPKAAIGAGLGSVSLGAGTSAVLRPHVIALSADALAQLMQRQASQWEKAALTLREMAQGLKGGGLSLDGHIGLVALLLNGLSAYQTFTDSKKSILGDAETFWGFADSAAGTFGGLAQVTHSALSSAIATRAGQVAAEKSLWVLGAGVAASGAGAFGGIATAAGQFVKRAKAEDATIARLYAFSGVSFFAQGTINGIQFTGAFSEFMIARGSQRAIWFTGARVAAGASTRLAAMTGMGLTGWGLIFLAGGLVFEVGVVLLTPDALQKHVQRSYFGKGGDTQGKYATLTAEVAALEAMGAPPKPADPANAAGNMTVDPVMVAP